MIYLPLQRNFSSKRRLRWPSTFHEAALDQKTCQVPSTRSQGKRKSEVDVAKATQLRGKSSALQKIESAPPTAESVARNISSSSRRKSLSLKNSRKRFFA